MTRRFFIGGGAAATLGAFGGCRFMPFFGADPSNPNLVFGVVSDIHITHIGADEPMANWGNNLTFRHTLEWFRDQGVDAVMIVGDMADLGMVSQLEAVAQAWYSVFPDDKMPDGRRVEKLFVYGNHDFEGYLYGNHAQNEYNQARAKAKDATKFPEFAAWSREHVLRTDPACWWKKIFHEDYSRLYKKTVKGYTFLGQHWDDGTDLEKGYGNCRFGAELQAFLDANGKSLDPDRPFFYFQHPHPKDTCYGARAWGHDEGLSTKALTPYANAIAFSGHSHYPLTDDRSIWQGAFTSVGTSSLRYTTPMVERQAPAGYENTYTEGPKAGEYDSVKAMPTYPGTGDCRQGMLWRVYDDRIVVRRREFLSNLDVGPAWVMPLPAAESRPFAFAERAKKAKAPQFAAGASATVKQLKAKTRGGVEKNCVELVFPPADAVADARVLEYEVKAFGADGQTAAFHVLAEGFNHAPAHTRAQANSSCRVSIDRLPAGTTRFEVTPLDTWCTRGKPLSVKFKVETTVA